MAPKTCSGSGRRSLLSVKVAGASSRGCVKTRRCRDFGRSEASQWLILRTLKPHRPRYPLCARRAPEFSRSLGRMRSLPMGCNAPRQALRPKRISGPYLREDRTPVC